MRFGLGLCTKHEPSPSQNFLRVFSIAGMQRHVMSVGGPIIALGGHEERLAVAFHAGPAVGGEQHVDVVVYEVGRSLTVTTRCCVWLIS